MHKKLLMVLVLIYLVYGMVLVMGARAGFPKNLQDGHVFPYLADKPVGEDGYYMLTIAWNMARGKGLVYNFDEPTTGVQPLATVFYSGLAWIVQVFGQDKWAFVRVVMASGIGLVLVQGHLTGLIARVFFDARDPQADFAYACSFVGTVFSFSVFRWFTYGLETGVYLVVLCLLMLLTLKHAHNTEARRREIVLLGVLGGVAGLARIDFAVVLGAFLAVMVIGKKMRVGTASVIGGLTLLMMLPWFLYVDWVSGRWLPSSGGAQASWITIGNLWIKAQSMGLALLGHATPWIYSVLGGVFAATALVSALVVVGWIFWGSRVGREMLLRLGQNPTFLAWCCAFGALVAVYLIFFGAPQFYSRYTLPIVIPLTVGWSVALALKFYRSRQMMQVLLLCVLPVCFFGWAFLSLHTGRLTSTQAITADFVMRNYPTERVGVFQSGIIGFFNENVVNLDGKVNYQALDASERHQLEQYIDGKKIRVLVDWPSYIAVMKPAYRAAYWQSCELSVPDNVTLCLERQVE